MNVERDHAMFTRSIFFLFTQNRKKLFTCNIQIASCLWSLAGTDLSLEGKLEHISTTY